LRQDYFAVIITSLQKGELMFWESFKTTSLAMAQIFILGAIGYFLFKKGLLKEAGLDILSRLVVEITLPLLIFCQLIKDFRFDLYSNWWIFPLLSLIITIAGLLLGFIFVGFIKGRQHKLQFLSLTAFQNSGYLPLALIVALMPKEQMDTMLVYLFLFLLGFNLVVWSFGVYMLSLHESRRFEMGSLFSPPVIATLISLAIIFFNLNQFIPQAILKPLRMVGDCTLPLAMFVVGGSLALIHLKQINKKAIFLIILVKLVILPVLGLWLILKFRIPQLLALLIIVELAVPPATSLSVITRHYKKEDLLISQGVFFGHLISLITLPLFLSLYFTLVMIK
jgi:predicted permease